MIDHSFFSITKFNFFLHMREYSHSSAKDAFSTIRVHSLLIIVNTFNILVNRPVKPVSHRPCGSRAPIYDDKFLGFVLQPRCCEQQRKTAEKQGRKAAAMNFRHVHFLCDLFAFSERCTTAVRHTRLSQDCCKTRKVFVRMTLFASHAFV